MRKSLVQQQQAKTKKPVIQPKLKVGRANNAFEEEADAMADEVESRITDRRTTKGIIGNSLHKKKAAKQPPGITPVNNDALGEQAVNEVPPSFVAGLYATKGDGTYLPGEVRESMEFAFSRDFSKVRLHTGREAAAMNRTLDAKAFTTGHDIYFGENQFSPGTVAGKKLLAHELTHVVQQQHLPQNTAVIQRKTESKKDKPEKKSILEADQAELDEFLKKNPTKAGYIEKAGDGVSIYLTNFVAKEYLVKTDLAWLNNKPIQLPNYERKTDQIGKWKEAVKDKIVDQYKVLSGSQDVNKQFMLSLKSKDRKQAKIKKGIAGTLEQLADETSVPFWNIKGVDNLYDVEHMVDWQIAGSIADDINNLILLDRSYNRSLGNKIKAAIEAHLNKITGHYSSGFTGLTGKADTNLKKFNTKNNKIFIKNFDTKGSINLADEKWYYKDEMIDSKEKGNPFNPKLIEVKDFKIPEGYFVLRTTDDRSGYFLPYNAKNEQIGAWSITSEYDKKTDTLKSIQFQILYRDTKGVSGKKGDLVEGKRKIKGTTNPKGGDEDAADIVPQKKESHIYEVQSDQLRRRFGRVFKELYGEVRELSPIELADTKLDGFDVSATGKVIPTLSFLDGVDIEYGIENGNFYIQANVPLEKLAKNFPKPFAVDNCNLVIRASSDEGLSVAGIIAFGIGNFGKGEIAAGIDQRGVNFTGSFDFNSKWFSKSNVTVSYAEGKWGISGTVAVEEGRIPGVKEASLTIGYKDSVFSANGGATLTVPGLNKLDLSAEFDEKGNFALGVETELGKLPGVKGGRVKVVIKSTEGKEGIQLRVEGDAVPDLPNVPSIKPKIAFLYDNGKFDINTEVDFNKGRFSGKIQIGVTNRNVDEKGKPTGDEVAPENNPIIVYGYGELTAILFKDNKGTVSVRLTPTGDVLVAGEIMFRNLKPFGDGTHFTKPVVTFPTIEIPLFGIPGMSISAFIKGGVFFKFDWEPLVLKELSIRLTETDIQQLEKAVLEIKGSIGSMADAQLYMTIDAGLKARVLIAALSGSIGGEAGLGLRAEAGGLLDAIWNIDKGLQFKEVRAFLNVEPRAIFRLVGKVSVDLDLWITTINLYYHEWVFADKAIDLSGLALKVDFPIQFDENNNVIPPDFGKMNVQQPDFTGDAGRNVLDNAMNSDAKKEEEAKREKIKADIKYDLRTKGKKEGFSLKEYTDKMKEKYENSKELQDFVVKTIEDESKRIEMERFAGIKAEIRGMNVPLENKLTLVNMFTMFNGYIPEQDVEAFRQELIRTEEAKKMIEQQTAAIRAEADRIAAEEKEKQAAGSKPVKPGDQPRKPATTSTANR